MTGSDAASTDYAVLKTKKPDSHSPTLAPYHIHSFALHKPHSLPRPHHLPSDIQELPTRRLPRRRVDLLEYTGRAVRGALRRHRRHPGLLLDRQTQHLGFDGARGDGEDDWDEVSMVLDWERKMRRVKGKEKGQGSAQEGEERDKREGRERDG